MSITYRVKKYFDKTLKFEIILILNFMSKIYCAISALLNCIALVFGSVTVKIEWYSYNRISFDLCRPFLVLDFCENSRALDHVYRTRAERLLLWPEGVSPARHCLYDAERWRLCGSACRTGTVLMRFLRIHTRFIINGNWMNKTNRKICMFNL